LVKVEGLVLYSTCSMNPIEDEAVLTELFRRANEGSFELVDLTQMLPELIKRPGVTKWVVMEEKDKKKKLLEKKIDSINVEELDTSLFNIYNHMSEIPIDYQGLIKPSMFCDDEDKMKNVYKLQHTVRILPHDQNTGGFYLALLRKKSHIVYSYKHQGANQIETKTKITEEEIPPFSPIKVDLKGMEEEDGGEENITGKNGNEDDDMEETKEEVKEEPKKEEPKKEEPKNQLVIPKQKHEQKNEQKDKPKKASRVPQPKKETYISFESDQWQWMKDYYGIDEEIIKPLMIWQNEGDRKILLVTPGIKRLLNYDRKGGITKVNMGTKFLARNKDAFMDNLCPYRICQDALLSVLPYMKNRKIKVSAEDFKFFVGKPNCKYSDIPNPVAREAILQAGMGALALYCEKEENIQDLDCMACLNFKGSITIMASKELIESFRIRYL